MDLSNPDKPLAGQILFHLISSGETCCLAMHTHVQVPLLLYLLLNVLLQLLLLELYQNSQSSEGMLKCFVAAHLAA